ncbi:hypothetical protein M5F00_09425 [Acinetobacter sp. ANC 4945]|nr:hypothetical protein [Acinetobacter amyesii]MCL6248082.1 hypothetical protein [Acinetobacter amyesii]
MKLKIEQLLNLSHTVTFDEQNINGFVRLEKKADVDLVNEFNDTNFDDLSFKLESYRFDIGDEVNYKIDLYHTGTQFASYENFIFHRFDLTKNEDTDEPFVIYEEIYSKLKGKKPISHNLELFSKFIKCLSEKYYHRDNQIIFFSKTHCEIFIQPRNYEKYINLALVYDELNLSEILKSFIDWLSVETPKLDSGISTTLTTHQNERYAIAATEFIDHLITFNKNEKIFMLLKNIDDIYKSIISKYSLYLEDFKYSKFTEKITEHSDEFLNKINKIISDLQTQILAVPLAVSFITVFKKAEEVNQFVYSGFLIYLLIVLYSCIQQAYNLKHIELQIQQFNQIAKLPTELSSQWSQEIAPVKKKLILHKLFFILISIFIGVLMGVCITHITIFKGFNINDCIFILIFISILIKIYRYFSSE